jgi:alkyl hydroperoxide reductase subunit AhpF
VALDGRNQIVVNPVNNSTNVPGVFAAGDVTSVNQKQVVISAGEGAKAALGVFQYLQALGKIKKAGLVDWGVSTPMHYKDISSTEK